jgi:putative hydrolase of the HAD superfamily
MSFKNIIFDLGGVLLDIDYQKTLDAFEALGFKDFDKHYSQAKQSGLFDDFEIGAIAPHEFIGTIKSYLPDSVSDEDVAHAWNALLLDWRPERISFLEDLASRYNLFLFSNTNAIHKAFFDRTFVEQVGKNSLDSYFVKAYYSHIFGRRKPHPESFIAILNENNLIPSETLFIDDSLQHVHGAREAGIHAEHLTGKSIFDLDL